MRVILDGLPMRKTLISLDFNVNFAEFIQVIADVVRGDVDMIHVLFSPKVSMASFFCLFKCVYI